MKIRKVTSEDAARICEIYNYYILHTAVTFETSAVFADEMRGRIESIIDSGDPYYVVERNDKTIGYCYLHKWKERSAYDTTKEVTIYLDIKEQGKGIGTALFKHMIDNLERQKIHVLLAGICLPNEASVKLHEKFGFLQVSCMKEIGRKFDKWQDVGHWQLLLNCE